MSSTNPTPPSDSEIAAAHKTLYTAGLAKRNHVVGPDYVSKALNAANTPFLQTMQSYVTEACWGSCWTRPGLELKTRSFLNIAMLCCQNRSNELATHIRGALRNGASEEEVQEVLLQAAVYCGVPAGMEGFKVAGRVLEEWNAEQKQEGDRVQMEGERDVDVGERMKMDDV